MLQAKQLYQSHMSSLSGTEAAPPTNSNLYSMRMLSSSLLPDMFVKTIHQHKEPPEFFSLFKETGVLIHAGSYEESVLRKDRERSLESSGVSPVVVEDLLFHVRGCVATQTEEASSSYLNSRDSFILRTRRGYYIWHGSLDNQSREATSTLLTSLMRREGESEGAGVVEMEEGQEPPEFWEQLSGGKPLDYARAQKFPSILSSFNAPSRLWVCKDINGGSVTAEEIHPFSQEDLDTSGVAILDTANCVYVWVGIGAAPTKEKWAGRVAEVCSSPLCLFFFFFLLISFFLQKRNM